MTCKRLHADAGGISWGMMSMFRASTSVANRAIGDEATNLRIGDSVLRDK